MRFVIILIISRAFRHDMRLKIMHSYEVYLHFSFLNITLTPNPLCVPFLSFGPTLSPSKFCVSFFFSFLTTTLTQTQPWLSVVTFFLRPLLQCLRSVCVPFFIPFALYAVFYYVPFCVTLLLYVLS